MAGGLLDCLQAQTESRSRSHITFWEKARLALRIVRWGAFMAEMFPLYPLYKERKANSRDGTEHIQNNECKNGKGMATRSPFFLCKSM
ncbi:hypothetical protein EDM57_00040 [Brevibacillus gelatini]|uniref:Uncharacterized protein n=1 Tax=Brevibacillus gelatini TaxID=1655277 RepID=A0A3M8BEY7_9BACL|nr:hypothetical protein EDM57_00040 [Brevibacillus gelatini]